MADVFVPSGEKSDSAVMPAPNLQGIFVPGIDDFLAIDGFGLISPLGGGGTVRKYSDYGISAEVSRQTTQLRDLAFIAPAGGGLEYGIQGDRGPRGLRGERGLPGIMIGFPAGYIPPTNSNFLAELPHNIDLINALGTAVDKLIYTDAYNTYTETVWTERQPAGDGDKGWRVVASDDDGSNLLVGVNGGRLYTSANLGVDWTERQPAGVSNWLWFAGASDNDGSHLIAIIKGQRLYTSANSGANWAESRPKGDTTGEWYAVASDGDGSHLIVAEWPGRLYTSANLGVDWTERQPAGVDTKFWRVVASDDDGSHLIAGIWNGRLYTSANSGANWTERQPAGVSDEYWNGVASDADGSHLIVGASAGRLYTSADYGVTWTERQPAGNHNQSWRAIASDSDGSHLIAGADGGLLYSSADYGVTWTEEQPAGAGIQGWSAVALDSDGSHLVAGIETGRLYTGVNTTLYSEATWAEADLTSAGRALLDDANAAAQATTLGLGTGDAVTHDTLTLSSIAAEGSDVDKFLVDSTGVIKYRTGSQVLSDIGGQIADAALDDLINAGIVTGDSYFLVGTGVGALTWETGATARTSMGVGAGDSPEFTGLTVSNLDDSIPDIPKDNFTGDTLSGARSMGNANRRIGNTFTAKSSYTISRIDLHIKRSGDIGDIDVELYAANVGTHNPTGPLLASGTIASADIDPSNYTWVTCILDDTHAIVQGQYYAIVFGGADLTVSRLLIVDDHDNGSGGSSFAGGVHLYSVTGGASWEVDDTTDILFKCYGGPPGYAELIGADDDNVLQPVVTGTGIVVADQIISISLLGIQALTDPGADRIMFWDDSETACKWLGMGNSVAITATTIDTIQDIRTSAEPEFAGLISTGVVRATDFAKTGWPIVTGATFSFDNATKVFKVTDGGSAYYYIDGVKYTLGGDKEVDLDDVGIAEGLWYIYFDGVTLTASQTIWSFRDEDKALVAYLYWDNTNNKEIFLGWEAHTFHMSGATHARLHYAGGARWEIGLLVSDNLDNTVDVSAGDVWDEDLNIPISDEGGGLFSQVLSPARLPIYYRDGASAWRKYEIGDKAAVTDVGYLSGGNLKWNDATTTWSNETVGGNNYVAYYVVATNEQTEPIALIMGQRVDNKFTEAKANNVFAGLSLAGLPFEEMVVLARLILKDTGTYTLEEVLDLRAYNIKGNITSPLITQHAGLGGLNWASAGHYFDAAVDFNAQNISNIGTVGCGVITQSGTTLANTYQPLGAGDVSKQFLEVVG